MNVNEKLQSYTKCLNNLEEAFTVEPSSLIIDGTFRRFKITFELAWKTLKDYLEYNGISDSIASPRGIIQLAYQSKIIKNGDIWIEMMLARNELSHLYDEDKSREIYNNIRDKYLIELDNLKNFLKEKVK